MLLANGHPEARDYPIGMVFDEASLVAERQNRQMASLGVIVQSATMTTGMGATKETAAEFVKLINGLNDEE